MRRTLLLGLLLVRVLSVYPSNEAGKALSGWTSSVCVVTERPRDSDDGTYEPEYSDDSFLKAIREQSLPTTTDVADTVGCDRSTAHYRLGKLADADRVESEQVGNAKVWSVIEIDDS